jgi:CRP-like cAMP-binding protein
MLIKVYLPQDIIISANAIGDAMFFIEHGAVSVLAPSGRAVAFLRDGDFFGELALITNEKRNATVVTTSFCDIYRLAKDDFDECIKGYPEVYHHLIKVHLQHNRKSYY